MTTKGQRFRARMAEKGFVQGNEWVPSSQRDHFRTIAKALREGRTVTIGEVPSDPRADTAPNPAKTTLDLSAFSKPTEDKPRIRAAEGSEHDLIAAYGVEIWPAESPSYSFDDAWAAYQLWKTEDQALSTAHGFERPSARGRHFMSQCDYLNRVSKGFVTAWRKIATAQFHNPEKADDCCCPSQHINIA